MRYDVYALNKEGCVVWYGQKVTTQQVFIFIGAFEWYFGKQDTRTRFHFKIKVCREVLNMKRLTHRRRLDRAVCPNCGQEDVETRWPEVVQEIADKLCDYEDAEEQGLLVRLPKNFKLMAAGKKTESNAIINELIHATYPYADDDDRLFKAVDALRVFVAQQNDFIDILSNFEAALKKD